MKPEVRAELTLPNDGSMLRVARACLREIAGAAELAAHEVEALVEAAEAACADMVVRAFRPGEPGSYRLAAALTPAAVTLAVQAKGLPFDPAASTDDPAPDRVGQYVAHHVVDRARWLNRGPAGIELRLTKLVTRGDVTEHLAAGQLTPFREDEPRAPEQEYTIRRLRAEDAIGVAQCVYRAYGYSYPNHDLYYPDRIAHLNATGELVSVVAVDAAGAVVGHLALERPDLGRVAESGQAVVAPAHRGRHLLERMRARAEEEGQQLGLVGIFGEPFTTHIYSQRSEEDFDAHVCGVNLADSPRSLHFKQIRNDPLAQRESTLLYFKYLAPVPAATVYAPPRHRATLERIYGQFGAQPSFGTPAAQTGAGEVAVHFDRVWGDGYIRVERVGQDTAAEIRRARRDLTDTVKVPTIFLELPLAQAGTPDLCATAEADGFFFAGIGPQFAAAGDALRLEYVSVPVDATRLQIASPFAKELVAYVDAERARATASPPAATGN
jgi:hypothetical protein